MPTSPNFTTFQNPVLSLWQSAIHRTLVRHAAQATGASYGAVGLDATAEDPHMVGAVTSMRNFVTTGEFRTYGAVAGDVGTCAELYTELAWDKVVHPERVPALENEIQDSVCDPLWSECITEYEKFQIFGTAQPYTNYQEIGDFVLTSLPDEATVAIIGDWGTGMGDATVLLEQIAANFKPDVLMHLGDIYYSGLPDEDAGNFQNQIESAPWQDSKTPLVFTLDGNHDRYAGSFGGYFPMIASLNSNQPASFFALRNNFWQFLAADTGYHDCDPFSVISNVTFLEPSEVAWHLDKINNNGDGVDLAVNPAGTRGTVLLSHHQLFSYMGVGENSDGKPLAINPNLESAFSPVFEQIALWLWGHEHNLCVFEPYHSDSGQMLPTGRCVGAGAIPVFPGDLTPPADLVLPSTETAPPAVYAGTALNDNSVVYNHAYAIIQLSGASMTVSYYQLDSSDATPGDPPPLAAPSYTETIQATSAKMTAGAA